MSAALSVFVRDPAEALRQASAAVGLAAWIELRLDTAPDLDFAELVRSMPLPVIAACPLAAEGGHFRGSSAARDARLRAAARGGARFVDLPLGAARPAGLPDAVRVVRSFHEPPRERADLPRVLRDAEAELRPGDVAKVVAWADAHGDGMRALALYEAARAPLVAFGQGPGGRASRAWAPVLGAPWTYACLEGRETAPGQWTLQELCALWPPGGPSRATGLFAVVGRPIGHSRSPLLWNTAFRLCGLDAFYVPLEAASFDGFLRDHGAPPFRGFSVTAPFKRAALSSAEQRDPAAEAAGAANTLVRTAGGWKAFDTDGPAALDALEAAGMARGAALLVVGAGGAARSVACEAVRRGSPVHVAARRAEAARDLASGLRRFAAAAVTAGSLNELDVRPFAALAHATPVGCRDAPGNLLAGKRLQPGQVVLDLVYDPPRTELLQQAAREGATIVEGHRMLVRQMLLQFRLCTGRDAPLQPLLQAVAANLERA